MMKAETKFYRSPAESFLIYTAEGQGSFPGAGDLCVGSCMTGRN